jgi:hypothetical protein
VRRGRIPTAIQRFAIAFSALFLAGPSLVLAVGTDGAGGSVGTMPGAVPSFGKVRLADAACYLLTESGAAGAVGEGHGVERDEMLDGCIDGSCWSSYVDPATESEKCAYGRVATLTLGIAKTARQAQQLVRRAIRRGYRRRVTRRADLAGVRITSKGAGIVFSVGRKTAVFSLSASSDNNPHPTWKGAGPEMLEDAIPIAQLLHQRGCPRDLDNCR